MEQTRTLTKRPFAAAFSGHRSISESTVEPLRQLIKCELKRLIEREGYRYFASGGASGFDTLAAQTVLSMKKSYGEIELYMVLPCSDQSKFFTSEQSADYQHLLAAAAHVRYTSNEPYYEGCMRRRNHYLVDHASVIIAYQTHGRSGTSQTTDYARKCGVKVINLADRL